MDHIAAYEQELMAYGTQALSQVPGLRDDRHGPRKGQRLVVRRGRRARRRHRRHPGQHGIAIRTGQHCAHPVLQRFGLSSTARASLGCYNTREEIDALVRGHQRGAGDAGMTETQFHPGRSGGDRRGVRLFDDWTDRFQYIIELGQKAPPVPEELQTEENQVQGCQSKVWLIPSFENGRLFFQAGSDAFISGGLVALAVRVYSGHTPDEILDRRTRIYRQDRHGRQHHAIRMNGLRAVIKKIKLYALAYKALQERQN